MASVPTSASTPSSTSRRMAWCSSESPSSRAEAIIPSETWPYVVRAAIGNGPGRIVPGRVTTTLSPTWKLRAPHTTPRTASPPSAARAPSGATRTEHHRIVLPFFCGSSVNSSTSPTTTGPDRSPPWTVSSSKPTRTRASWSASGVALAGRSAHSASQDRGILT